MKKTSIIFHALMAVVLAAVVSLPASAQNTPNARQARSIFDRAFDQVFNSPGCRLYYDVNLVGIYKCHGWLWIADKKSRFKEDRIEAWNEGETYYRVDNKRKEVEIHNTNSPKKDKYTSKFQFKPDEYDYHVADGGNTYLLTMKLRKGGKSTIKQVKAEVTKRGLEPVSVSAKLYFFWCKVKVSHYYSGHIEPSVFVFPRKKFASYKFIDKRPE